MKVLEKNQICSSDHFGITFSLKMDFRKKLKKRKIFNYKKANWEGLTNDLKFIKWDHCLHCDAETGWYRFKTTLFHHMRQHIPTILITDRDQPSIQKPLLKTCASSFHVMKKCLGVVFRSCFTAILWHMWIISVYLILSVV